MKNNYSFLILFTITLGLISGGTSCTKFRENREYFTLYDHDAAEDAYNDLFRLTCQEGDPFSSTLKDSCYTVSLTDTAFPKTYTFAFGSTDCTDRYQMIRRGSATITFSQNFATTGAVATVTPGSDYYFNNYKVQGVMTITNNGLDNNGKQIYSLVVTQANLTTPQNQAYTWACNHTMKLFLPQQGLIFDDIYHYTGTANGVDHEGFTYAVSIDDSLVKEQNCRWPSEGNITIKITGLDDKEVNYGDNDCTNTQVSCCDNIVYVKTGGKNGQNIQLN